MSNIYNKIFPFLFCLVLLFAIFLIETEYKFHFFALIAGLLTFVSFMPQAKLSSLQNRWQRPLTIAVAIFILGMTVSTSFSHHYPLSLEKYLFYLTSMGVFIFFLRRPMSRKSRELLVDYLLLLSLVLNALVLVLHFLPQSYLLFQSMNLLVRSYGHSHYAAFLLLTIPLMWYRLLAGSNNQLLSNTENKFLMIVLLSSSYVLLLLAMGRVALLISLLQLVLVVILNRYLFYQIFRQTYAGVFFKMFTLLFAGVSVTFIFLSLPFFNADGQDCPLNLQRKDLCISFQENSRIDYWRKAVVILHDNLIFGYGLKTFSFASRQYPNLGNGVSAYAHNIFLHNLAEMGLVGGLPFILLIAILFAAITRVIWNKLHYSDDQTDLSPFLYVAVLSSLLNAMLDFDWHFFVIFNLTLIFAVFILQPVPLDIKSSGDRHSDHLSRVYFSLLFILTASVMVFYQVARFWQERGDSRWQQFAFFDSLIRSSSPKALLSAKTYQQQLDRFYQNDPSLWIHLLNAKDNDHANRVPILLKLSSLDPLEFAHSINFTDLELTRANQLLQVAQQTWSKYQMIDNYRYLEYHYQLELAKQLEQLGNTAYERNELTMAANFYQAAKQLDKYIFTKQEPRFLLEDDLDKWYQFISIAPQISPHDCGDFYRYMQLSHSLVQRLFLQQRFAQLRDTLQILLAHEPPAKYYLLNSLQEFGLYQKELTDIYQEFNFQ